MLDKELIEVYQNTWGTPNVSKLSSIDSLIQLNIPANWQPPKVNQICYKISTTDTGKLAYKNMTE